MPLSEHPQEWHDRVTTASSSRCIFNATLWVVALIAVPILARQHDLTSPISIGTAAVLGVCVIWGLLRL